MEKKISEYINKQPQPQKTLLKKSRRLILDNILDCKEEFKWGVPVYDDGKFYIAAMKSRIHIGFAITGLSQKEIDKFDGTGKTMRHIKIYSVDEFDETKLKRLIKLVHTRTTPLPDYRR